MLNLHSSFALCAAALLVQPLALVRAQAAGSAQILPADLPVCAQTCSVLQQAVATCQATNPTAPSTCFCQSPQLAQLPASNANVCVGQCADPDFETIRTWYRNFCADPANPGGGQQDAATPTDPNGNIAVQPPPGQEPPASTSTTASYLTNPDLNRPESGSEWWTNHWQWVLMVIILVLAFSAIGIGGSIWYKRRQRRKEGWDDPRPEMSAWAPNQHNVHDLNAPASAAPVGRRNKGKEQENPVGNPVKGSRLKKMLGRA